MFDYAIRRMENGKDVPPYMLKEIIELIQAYIIDSHKVRENIIPALVDDRDIDTPSGECEEIYSSLRKYNRFLLGVVEAYDLGYDGARGVFARYAGQYLSVLTDYFELVNELVVQRVGGREQRDREFSKRLKKIDDHAKKARQRRLIRMETLRNELLTVAA